MKLYQLLKLNQKLKSRTIKLLGILAANILGFRHLSVRIDPVLACNLACRMCYFSSPEKRKELKIKGSLTEQEIESIAKVLFPKAFQVFIGCGAEPTLSKHFIKLAELAKQYNVPDIGIVSNGLLMSFEDIESLVKLNINEIALSLHGVSKDVYEKFMVNGEYEKFIERLNWFNEIKKKNNESQTQLRINFTVNSENLNDLHHFFDVFGNYPISTLQIRPVMDIGGQYSESIKVDQEQQYNTLIEKFKEISKNKGLRLLANTIDTGFKKENKNGAIADAVYCYISNYTATYLGFKWCDITFNEFMRRKRWRSTVIKSIFNRKASIDNKNAKYEVL